MFFGHIVAATGFSIIFVIAYATPTRWFDRRRGLATGIAAAGGAGALVVPPLAEVFIAHVGWRGAYGGLTLSFVVVLAVTILVIADRPATLGIDTSTESPTGALDEKQHATDWHDQIGDVLVVARSPPFLVLFLAFLSFAIPTAMVMVHIVEFTTTEGIGRALGVAAVSVIGLMSMVGRSVGGGLSDRVGRVRTIAASGLLLGIGIAVLVVVHDPRAIIVAAVVFGVGWGFWIGLLASFLADLFGTLSINALFGIVMIALAIAAAGAPYAAGVTFDVVGTFEPAFIAGGVLGILGSGLVLAVSRLRDVSE